LVSVTPEKLQYELRVLVTQLAPLAHRDGIFLRQAMGRTPPPPLPDGEEDSAGIPGRNPGSSEKPADALQGIKGGQPVNLAHPAKGLDFPCVDAYPGLDKSGIFAP